MGLRCLLSHDFGEPELEREREEQGNEVIITVNEVKTCRRCGEQRVVSENTEVTSMEQLTATATSETGATTQSAPAAETQSPTDSESPSPAQTASAEPDTSEPTGTTTADQQSHSSSIGVTIDDSVSTTDDAEVLADTTEDGDDTEIINETDTLDTAAGETTVAGESETETGGWESTEEMGSDPDHTATDDGIILPSDDDDEPEAEREPGQWPEYETDQEPTEEPTRSWPTVDEEDEGYAAGEPTEDETDDITFGGGFTPEITESDRSADDGEQMESSFTRAEESVDYEPTVDDIQTEFYCPECGLTKPSGDSSMRAGDICPDCRRGYISERPN
jgi:predicted RNA-binding Zn-ribbon protein involved in translation (DUF1610 family)